MFPYLCGEIFAKMGEEGNGLAAQFLKFICEQGYRKVLGSKYLTKKEGLNRIYSKCQD